MSVRFLEDLNVDGNVGIGVASPITELQIGDSTSSQKLLLLGPNSISNSSEIIFGDSTSVSGPNYAGVGIRYNSSSNNLSFRSFYSGAEQDVAMMTLVRDGGNVGIGTASPSEKLEVAGNIAVSGTVDGVDIAARDAVLTSTTTTANAALPKAGGTMTGQLIVNHNAGTLNLVGTDHTYIQWYPAGLGGGRHAYTGFAGGGTDHFTIANETSGAHINLTTNSGTVNVTGNLGVTGTVDGRDVATDGTKLDTISTNADVTPSWVPSSDPGYGTSNLALGTTSSTALAGNTTTISTAQANAITANTAKRDARYIYVPVVCNFYGDLSTGEYHVPFSDGETESTSTTNRRNQFVAPCDGHFHKVIVRSNNSTLERGSATDLTIKSKKVVAGTASVTTLETKVVDTVAAETKMVTTFDSTNSAFDEGDRLLLSMQLTDGFPRGSKSYFVTVVFKIDQSDLD